MLRMYWSAWGMSRSANKALDALCRALRKRICTKWVREVFLSWVGYKTALFQRIALLCRTVEHRCATKSGQAFLVWSGLV